MAAPLLATLFPLILALAHGSVDFYLNIIQALVPSLARHLDVPLSRVIILMGAVQFIANFIQPAAGWLMGKRNLAGILWAGTLLAILPAGMGLTHSFGIVAVLVILGAVGTGIFHPEGVVSLHQAAGRQAHFLVPFFMACGFFFSAAAAPVSIYWVENLGFPSLYWLALPGLVLALLLFLHRRRDRRDHPGTAHQRHSQRRVGVSSAQPSFWPLLATAGALNIATALFMALLTSHYEIHFGSASHRTAGWMLLLMGGLASLVSFFWGHLTRQDRFRRFYLLVLASQLLATPLFFWLPHAATPTTGLVICIALSLIAPGAIYPVSVTLSRDTSGLTHSLRAALMIGGTWGTAALVVTLSGILLEAGVDTRQLLSGSAFFTLVAALIALWQVLARGWGKGAEEIGSAGRE